MAYNKKVIETARRKLNARREIAEKSALNNKLELIKKNHRVKEILANLETVGPRAARAVVSGKKTVEALELLRDENLALQEELNKIIEKLGLPRDYLNPQYKCVMCSDTGMLEISEENKTCVCECYKKLLSQTVYESLNEVSPLKLSTFDTFNMQYYSHEVDTRIANQSPLVRMTRIFNHCVDYAKNFNLCSKSLIMRGPTGLGKTHLSLAIANVVIQRGYDVVYVSAPAILQKLEREHFGKSKVQGNSLEHLEQCDLLILDDLGTEFDTQFTSSTIYNLYNTRLLYNRPTIINTNLTIEELADKYSDRFTSRLIGSADKLDFIGKDIRGLNL